MSDGSCDVSPQCNLLDMPYHVSRRICDGITVVDGLVERLMASVNRLQAPENRQYTISDIERHSIMKHERPCERLFQLWGTRGMLAQQLVILLDDLRAERPLLSLIDPMPLELQQDVSSTRLDLTEGDTLSLRCLATGFPYPRYCWFRDNTLRDTNSVGRLEITNVGLNDTGTYTCRIHNRLQQYLFTSKCYVYVKENIYKKIEHPEPVNNQNDKVVCGVLVFTSQLPDTVSVAHGEQLTLCVEVQGGATQYIWCRDEEALPQQPHSNTLKIPEAYERDRGTYHCIVYKDGQSEKSKKCSVNIIHDATYSPVIKSQPSDTQAAIQATALFRVRVECLLPHQFQWFHNGKPLTAPSCYKNELRVDIERRDQAGVYSCKISTLGGRHQAEVISREAKLEITRNTTKQYTATDKLAILLGQSSYQTNNRALPAVKNDIYAAYNAFKAQRFKVIATLDESLKEMWSTINMAIELMKHSTNTRLYVALYVVGHGFRHGRFNYLVPTSALEGTALSECLCVEEVAGRLNQHLKPALYFFVGDICQTENGNVIATNPPHQPYPVCNERVVFYAASLGQEALEENQGSRSDIPKDYVANPNPRTTPEWRNITQCIKLRGIFSKELFKVLHDSKDLILHNLYKAFNDKFKRPDPTDELTKGREQNPVNEISLSLELSLSDTIDTDGQQAEYENRVRLYADLNGLPPEFSIVLAPDWCLKGQYRARLSNVMELVMWEEDRRQHTSLHLTYNIQPRSYPTQLGPSECYSYSDDMEKGVRQKRGYIFYNLQKLQCMLSLMLDVEFDDPKVAARSYKLHVGAPLVSNVTMNHQVAAHTPSTGRQACEHTETDRLSSLESSS